MARKYHLGCSGYFYWSWRGKWYPAEVRPGDWFHYYSRHFDTVEINATFYRFPTATNLRRWQRQSPPGFVFTIKAPRVITHIKKFSGTKRLVEDLCQTLSTGLGKKLGCVLFQMPPGLRYSRAALSRILDQLDPALRNVIEFRHSSWWRSTVYKELSSHGVAFCSISAPKLPDDLVRTSNLIYIRFHGNPWYRHDYSDSELVHWARRIRTARAPQVFAYFNNDYEAFAPRNCLRLRRLLARR